MELFGFMILRYKKIGKDKTEFLRLLLMDELCLNLRNDDAYGLS